MLYDLQDAYIETVVTKGRVRGSHSNIYVTILALFSRDEINLNGIF